MLRSLSASTLACGGCVRREIHGHDWVVRREGVSRHYVDFESTLCFVSLPSIAPSRSSKSIAINLMGF